MDHHPMTPDRWQRLKLLYEAASQLSRNHWEPFISAACAEDDELAAALRRLLENDNSGGLLDHPIVSLCPRVPPAAASRAFLPGQLVDNRFEIASFLGRGGMGEVYKAFDRELQEHVALKTVRGDARDPAGMFQRLRQEVRRSRRIAHPNVCRVYDIFVPSGDDGSEISFLTMQLLTGPTLAQVLREQGPMMVAKAAPVAKQMLGALSAAHQAGIIHRDLKPGNVMLIGDGVANRHAVVTDFGLSVERFPGSAVPKDMTGHSLAGTPAYMAPEQFKGMATTASDIYSFGVVLFEMFTGTTPSPISSDPEMDPSNALSKPAVRLLRDVPKIWRGVIMKCLETRPQDRFASTEEILAALETGPAASLRPIRARLTRRDYVTGLSTTAAVTIAAIYTTRNRWHFNAQRPSLVVLPFRVRNPSSDGSLLADGLTDGLIEGLRQRKLLRVIAHRSAFHYRGQEPDPRTMHRDLNVTHIVSGSIETADRQIRLSASLVTAPAGKRIWAKEYTRPVSSILVVLHEMARDIVSVLKASAGNEQFFLGAELSPSDLEAYKLYLKGRYQWNLRTESGLRQAIEYFREAIGMDPGNERAFCGLADSYALLGLFGFARPNDVMPEAKIAAQRALMLNDALAEAYASLGFIQAVYNWDWAEADASLKRATRLDPGYVTGHDWYAFCLAWTDQPQPARAHMEEALELDPFSPAIGTHLAWLAFWSRDYSRAEALLRRTIALSPNPNATAAHALLALACAQQSRFPEALTVIQSVRKLDRDPGTLPDLARIYALAGQRSNAQRTISEAEFGLKGRPSSGVTMAMACEALGDREKAFAWLSAAYQERASEMAFLKVDPRLDGLRSDGRFTDLLKKVNLLG